jgi:uncharacterized protein YndB with AHSA1/START domain
MVYFGGLDATFRALADPTRRAILERLAGGDRTISELAARFDMTLPAVSKHVRVLERAGLAVIRREGRARRCTLVASPMREAALWIAQYRAYWDERLDRLASYLEDTLREEEEARMAGADARPAFRLEIRRTYEASRERVYRAWTEVEALKRWHAPADAVVALAEADVRVGGQWRIHMQGEDGNEHRVSGEYREIEPPRRLVFTWQWDHHRPDYVMVVTVDLHERGGQTELVLTHEGFRSEEDRTGHAQGWDALLTKLAASLE